MPKGGYVDRMQRHIARSEMARGLSPKRANRIAWARLNKLGLLHKRSASKRVKK